MAKRSNVILTRDDLINLCKETNEPVTIEMGITGYGCGYNISLAIIGKFEERGEKPHSVFSVLTESDTKPNKNNNSVFELTYDKEIDKLKIKASKTDYVMTEGPKEMTQQNIAYSHFILGPIDRTQDFANSVIR